MGFKGLREQLLKEGKQAKCKFCHRQLKTKIWLDVLLAQERTLSPQGYEYRQTRLINQGYILPSGLCVDCSKFAEKLDKELGG